MIHMKLILPIISMFAMCVALCAAEAEKQKSEEVAKDGGENTTADAKGVDEGFARYQSIIDRQPFGPPPPGFDPSLPVGQSTAGGSGPGGKTEAEISAEEQKMMSSVRVSVLNVTPSGSVMVGFTDSTTQPPVNYYLKVGDTSTDAAKWTVKDADPAAGTVTLCKDDIDITLSVGGETKKGTPVGKPAVDRPAGVLAGPQGLRKGLNRGNSESAMPADVGDDATLGAGGALSRLRHRRMMKRAEEAAQRQEADNARAALAKEKEEREREREREREQLAAEREQQRQALLQIQEELRRQREAKAAQKAEAVQTDENRDE